MPMKVRLSTALPLSLDQGIIGCLARKARYSGLVISFRQFSRSSISPCEQVGEHHGGADGCLASGDSGGIRAGATDGGGKLVGVTAQPLASSIGISSASISSLSFFLGMGSRLLLRRGASLFFLPGAALTDHFGQAVTAISLR
ncbi:hypothetical protein AYJ70_20935 [Pseudomonas monteilii]|uniref:Uncharacterized protein n=1 Tax=Pseudomonas monteilii TaxID=76759 RepID=A0AAP7FIL9_9PSED|nr:hypothetical protein AYJ70_20935 [Pseudomonas monteilii]